MDLVVTDTGPPNYLILIGHIHLLQALFQEVALPNAVRAELADAGAPPEVRRWIADPPSWAKVHQSLGLDFEAASRGIHEGEREALALASRIGATLLLMDDRRGVDAAKRKGFRVTGTLGILDLAAQRRLVDLPAAFARLRRTTFRCPDDIMEHLLARHRQELP